MNSFVNAMLAIFGMLLTMVVGIFIMIVGWGLEPQNWFAILGGYFMILFINMVMQTALKSNK